MDFPDTFFCNIREWLSRKEAFAFFGSNTSALTLLSSANIIPYKLCIVINKNIDANSLENYRVNKDVLINVDAEAFEHKLLVQLSIHTPCCCLCTVINEQERHALSTIKNVLPSYCFDYESKEERQLSSQQKEEEVGEKVMHVEMQSRERIIRHLIESMHQEKCIWNVINTQALLFCGPSLQLSDSLIVRYYCAAVSVASQKTWKLSSSYTVNKTSSNTISAAISDLTASTKVDKVDKEKKTQVLFLMPRGSNTEHWEAEHVRQVFTFLRDSKINNVKCWPYNLEYVGANTNLRILNMLFSSRRKRMREHLLRAAQPNMMESAASESLHENEVPWREQLTTFNDHVIYNISLLLTLYGFEVVTPLYKENAESKPICSQADCYGTDNIKKATENRALTESSNNEASKESTHQCDWEHNLHKTISDVFACRFCGARLHLEELLGGEESELENKENQESLPTTSNGKNNGDYKGTCHTYLFTISAKNALNPHHHACPWFTFFLQQIVKVENSSADKQEMSSQQGISGDRTMDFDFCIKYTNQYLWTSEERDEQSSEPNNVFVANYEQRECNKTCITNVDQKSNNGSLTETHSLTTSTNDTSTQHESTNVITQEEEELHKQVIKTKTEKELTLSDTPVTSEEQLPEKELFELGNDDDDNYDTTSNNKDLDCDVDNGKGKVNEEIAEEQSDVSFSFHTFHSNTRSSSLEPSETSIHSHDICDTSLPTNIIRFRFYLSEVHSLLTCWRHSLERDSSHGDQRLSQYKSSPLMEFVTGMLYSMPTGMESKGRKGHNKHVKTKTNVNNMYEDVLEYHTHSSDKCKELNSIYSDLWNAVNLIYHSSQENRVIVPSETKTNSMTLKTFVDKGLSILSGETSAKDKLTAENLERYNKEVDKFLFVTKQNLAQTTTCSNPHLPELIINMLTESLPAGESFREQTRANNSKDIETETENILKEIDNAIRNGEAVHQRRKLHLVETGNTNNSAMIKEKNAINEQSSAELQLPLKGHMTLPLQEQSYKSNYNNTPAQLQQQWQAQPLLPTQVHSQFTPFAPSTEFNNNNNNNIYANTNSSTMAFNATITSHNQTAQPLEICHPQNKTEYPREQQTFFLNTHMQTNKSINVQPIHHSSTNVANRNYKKTFYTSHPQWQPPPPPPPSQEQQTSLFGTPPALSSSTSSSASAFVSEGNVQPFVPYAPQQPFQNFNEVQWQSQEQAHPSQPVLFNTFRANNKSNVQRTESVLGSPFNINSAFADNSHHGILSSPVVSNNRTTINSSVPNLVNFDGNAFSSAIANNTNQTSATVPVREKVNVSNVLPQMPMQYGGVLGNAFDDVNNNNLINIKNNNNNNRGYIGDYSNTVDANAEWGILDSNFNNSSVNFPSSSTNAMPASNSNSLPLQHLLPSSSLSSPEPSLQSTQQQLRSQSSWSERGRGRGRGGVYDSNINNSNSNNVNINSNMNNVMNKQQQKLNYGRGAAAAAAGGVRGGYAVNNSGRTNQHNRGNNALARKNFSRP